MKYLTTVPLLLCGALSTQIPTSTLPTVPVELAPVDGYLTGAEFEDIWTTSHKRFYMTSLKVWKDANTLSGVEATFSQPSSFNGWPDETQMFGATTLTSHYEEFNLTDEIMRISLCC